MTADQMAIGDCDPLWHDWDELCQLGAEELEDPVDRGWRDLRGQHITKRQYYRTQTVKITGSYL